MKTITEVIAKVQESAKSPLKEARVIDDIQVNQFVRQGDLYIIRIGSAPAWKERQDRQLVAGSTQGSRHTVDASVKVLDNPNCGRVEITDHNRLTARCIGHALVADTRFTVSHPEHCDMSLPAGCYMTQYQVDPRSMQRVLD